MLHFTTLTSPDIDKVLVFDEYSQIYPSRRDEVLRAIHDHAGYVMYDEAVIVGYGIFRPYSLIEESFVHLLIIDRQYRGRGYATEFLRYFESLAPTERIHISVNVSNLPMQNLVTKLGYREGGRLSNFDPDDPEIFYWKKL